MSTPLPRPLSGEWKWKEGRKERKGAKSSCGAGDAGLAYSATDPNQSPGKILSPVPNRHLGLVSSQTRVMLCWARFSLATGSIIPVGREGGREGTVHLTIGTHSLALPREFLRVYNVVGLRLYWEYSALDGWISVGSGLAFSSGCWLWSGIPVLWFPVALSNFFLLFTFLFPSFSFLFLIYTDLGLVSSTSPSDHYPTLCSDKLADGGSIPS